MKLIRENKFVVLFFSLFLIACQYKSEKELISGTWKYKEILKNDSPFVTIHPEDKLLLKENGEFEYSIKRINKRKNGRWTYNNDTLLLAYSNSDTVRTFEVEIIGKHDLKFRENKLYFSFTRER